MLGKRVVALSWSQLSPLAARWSAPPDPTSGPTSAQSRLRLFGAKESDVRVTLYRDNHAWCAYSMPCTYSMHTLCADADTMHVCCGTCIASDAMSPGETCG